MRKDIKINVDTQTDGISLSSRRLGISSENLQGKIIFTPKPFIDGICRMYIEGHGTIEMDKQEDCYTLDIKSSLLITPSIDVCFKITEPEKENGVPIFATKIMHFEVLDTIESNEPIPEQYPQWKDVLDNYTEEKKSELDTHVTEIQTDLKAYKKDLEDEMSTTKDTLTGEITATATEKTNEFNTNAESKTNAFNDNATEKTTNYNTNAETKLKEYNDNSTTKTEEYNTNATNKVNEFNNNVDSLENELTELASQMPWNTTEIQDSIHVEDSAKYSRNKLGIYGNLEQEVSETGNNIFDGILEAGNIGYETGLNEVSDSRVRSKNYIDVSGATKITIVAENEYETAISIGLRLYDKDYNYIGRNAVSDFTKSVSFNVNSALIDKTTVAKYCRFNVVDTDITKKFSVNINETLEYEEYIPNKPSIEYPSMPVVATGVQKIKRIGKNFLNVEKNVSTSALGVTATTDKNGIITINGTTTGALYLGLVDILKAYNYGESSKLIKSKLCKGVYKVSFKYISGTATSANNNTNIQFRDGLTSATSTMIKSIANLGTSDKAISATLDKDKEFYTYLWADTNTTFTDYKFTVHIEKVESETDLSTDYEPYKEETFELDLGATELCKIVDENGNTVAQDRAVYKDGKWQWEKNVGKTIFNGTEEWIRSTSYLGSFYRAVDKYNAIKNDILICNMAKYENKIENYSIGKCINNGNFSFWISDNIKFPSTAEWKTFLSDLYNTDNPLIIYYPHKTVIYEDCTPAQSEVLDKLYKLTLQKGTNNIYVESENGVTTELQLTYMQDLMSQINELKQAMLNIGGN